MGVGYNAEPQQIAYRRADAKVLRLSEWTPFHGLALLFSAQCGLLCVFDSTKAAILK